MANELALDGASPPVLALGIREAARQARDRQQVTHLTHNGERIAAIVPCAGSMEEGYSELEAAVAEVARLQGPYQQALARLAEVTAREQANLNS
jgi:hypothetical protein